MKTTVHSIRPGSEKNVFLVELTGNGKTGTFKVRMHPDHEIMVVDEENEDEFEDIGAGNIGMSGKLVALVARVRRGEAVDFPVEIQRGRPA